MKHIITQQKLNLIIDSLKPLARKNCDAYYDKTIEMFGPDDKLKTLVDKAFDSIADTEVQDLKTYFNNHFTTANTTYVDIETFIELIHFRTNTYEKIQKEVLSETNKTISYIIHQAFSQSILEEVYEYCKNN